MAKKRRRRSKKRGPPSKRRGQPRGRAGRPGRVRRLRRRLGLFGLVAVLVWALVEGLIVYRQFEGRRWSVPARVYASPFELYVGRNIDQDGLIRVLEELGYRRADGAEVGAAAW